MSNEEPTLAQLFRQEHGRLVSGLVRVFGMNNLAVVEDVVQDALCRAIEVWKLKGVPENPGAWLTVAARRRAIDVLRREKTAHTFAPEISRLIDSEWTLAATVDGAFEDVKDSELRMMFSLCHPSVPEKAQIALVLDVMCGFSMKEVAAAFLDPPAAMEKRLQRAKRDLAEQQLFAMTSGEVAERRATVLRALYLLYNEGYHGSTHGVRVDLCGEATRLLALLTAHAIGDVPEARALLALMYLHSARLPARIDADGVFVPLEEQDRSRIDRDLVRRGTQLLESAAVGDRLSEYHIEAAIAAEHAMAPSFAKTDFRAIADLYRTLLGFRPTPVVELNYAIAIAEVEGPEVGLAALDRIDQESFERYPFFEAARAEMLTRMGKTSEARTALMKARDRARTDEERRFFERKL